MSIHQIDSLCRSNQLQCYFGEWIICYIGNVCHAKWVLVFVISFFYLYLPQKLSIMMKRNLILLLCVAFCCGFVTAQKNNKNGKSTQKESFSVSCVAFYNLENLFDTIDDPNNSGDDEYLPDGPNRWTGMKYRSKQKNMAYAISQIGTDVTPVGAVIVGVSEVENKGVLEDLVKQPALQPRNYQVILEEGPDHRGIDVGLLYNPTYFTPTATKAYPLYVNGELMHTRFQLLVSGYLQGEKIHVIVNHWPSRYGGEEASRPNRIAAALSVKAICDSLYNREPKAKIIIMGDLNDDPYNESCAVALGAKKEKSEVEPQGYYNTLWKTLDKGIGSLAYNGQWNLFDQIIISGNLANADRSELSFWKAEIFNRPFLVEQEGKRKGSPKRTFASGVWTNGYSDHFPTYIYLIKKQ